LPRDTSDPSVTFIAKGESDERRVVEEIQKRLGDVKFEF
jgi:LL-diaminopimelate aminotransferase